MGAGPYIEQLTQNNSIFRVCSTKNKGQKQTRCGQAVPVENNMDCALLHPPLERLDFILHPLHLPLWIPALSPIAVTCTWMWLSALETLEFVQHGGSNESSDAISCISQSTFSSPSWSLNLHPVVLAIPSYCAPPTQQRPYS